MPSEQKEDSIIRGIDQKVWKLSGGRLVGACSSCTDLRSTAPSIACAIRQPTMSSALKRLRSALSAMPREQRFTALQSLSGRVRALLLAHMESDAQLSASRSRDMLSTSQAPAPSMCMKGDLHDISSRKASQRTPVKRNSDELGGLHPRAGVTRVGKDRWRAHVFFLNIRSITACVSSHAEALLFQTVLAQLKRAVLDTGENSVASGTVNVKDVLTSAERTLADACAKHGLAVEELGLAYRAEVPAGQLLSRDVWGRYTLELQKAFAERDALLAGKAAGWPSLRAAWIAILQEPLLLRRGSVPNWTRKRSPLCARRAAAIADAAWEAGASRRERAIHKKSEKERRRLCKAAARRCQKWRQDCTAKNRQTNFQRQAKRIASATRAVERAAASLLQYSRCKRLRRDRQHLSTRSSFFDFSCTVGA